MRLDDETRSIIKNEVASQFGAAAVVRLFGSRVDDAQRGGVLICILSEPDPGKPHPRGMPSVGKLEYQTGRPQGGCVD